MSNDNTPEPAPESAFPPPSYPHPAEQPSLNPYDTSQWTPPAPEGTAQAPPSDPYQPDPAYRQPTADARPGPGTQAWPPPPVTGYPPMASPQYSPVNGTMILILGILGVTVCLICAPIAWVLGNQAMATLSQYGDPLSQRGIVNGGRICGIIGSALLILALLVYGGLIVYGVISGTGSGR